MKRIVVVLCLLSSGFSLAQVTSPEEFLAYRIGDYLTDHDQMLAYMRRLDTQSERVRVISCGQSYERREMILVIISSAENMARLETIRNHISRLKDAENTSPEEARSIIESTPAVGWMNYANDGNESAAFEAALQVAYQLASGTDPVTLSILNNLVTVINPAHNPDSHQRYVTWFKATAVGPYGTADPQADEHRGEWRMSTNNNHYQIDLNRDGFAATQPETRAIVEQLHRWNPQVFVDHHGETPSFFFAPYALPMNKNLPETTREWSEIYGKANADAFSKHGWSFFAREVFDIFYAGYWDSYPALNGAIGMTYESEGGGRKGFQMEREDGTVITLREGVLMHITASITTLKTTAENRHKSLTDYYNFRKSALDQARQGGPAGYVLLEGKAPGLAAELASLLRFHRIKVFRVQDQVDGVSTRSYSDNGVTRRTVPAGSYFIPVAQTQARLLRSLLDQENALEESFLAKVRKAYEFNVRKGKDVRSESFGFYDITAWNLPLAYGLEAWEVTAAVPALQASALADEAGKSSGPDVRKALYGYLFPFQELDATRLLARLLAKNYHGWISAESFTQDGREFSGPTVLFRTERNPESLHQDINELARQTGVEITPVDSAWTEKGILLGSSRFVYIKKPRLAILTEPPTDQRAYGALWFLFEQDLRYPFTALSLDYFQSVDLSKYEVLIFPEGSRSGFKERLGKEGTEKIKDWIQKGGVFIGIAGGAAFTALDDVKWTDVKLIEHYGEEEKKEKPEKEKEQPAEEKRRIFATPGAILKANLDTEYYLAYGYEKAAPVLIGSDYFLSQSQRGQNVAVIDSDQPLISGFMFDESRQEAKGKAYLVDVPMGRGHVILFADEPVFRLYWKGLAKLFFNAVFLSPGR